MADNPNEQSGSPGDSGQSGFNQDEIDAIVNQAGAESSSDPPSAEPPAESGEISQADIDAMMSGGQAAEPGGSSASDAAPSPSDDGPVTQADVDALVNAAKDGAGDEASPTESEGESPEEDARLDSLGRPFDGAAAAMQAAIEAEQAATQASAPPPPDVKPYEPQDFGDLGGLGIDPKRITMLNDVKLRVKIQLGRTRMLVEDVLKLDEGSVVELDKLAGDPVDMLINDRLIARGEVLVLNDSFCVRISEVFSHDPHRITT